MSQVPRRAKRFESVFGSVYLLHLVVVAAALLVIQSRYDMARFGLSATAGEQAPAQPKAIPQAEKPALSLSVFATTDLSAIGNTEMYDSDNLYEKIDGKAPLYLEAGFKELTTQRFASKSDPNLWMEIYIYDMGNIKNAFCVYSEQRREGSEAFAAIPFAYKTGNALYFVHGKYYIEIVGSSESEELFKATAELAQKSRANLTIDPNTSIAELAFFPQENLVADSFKLYAASAFGCEKLTDVFTARYKIENESVTAFISKKADAKEAEATLESYRKFLTENGATEKTTDNKIFAGKVIDLYGATEIVFTEGPFIAGVHEAENQQTAEKLAEILINRLDSLKNE